MIPDFDLSEVESLTSQQLQRLPIDTAERGMATKQKDSYVEYFLF